MLNLDYFDEFDKKGVNLKFNLGFVYKFETFCSLFGYLEVFETRKKRTSSSFFRYFDNKVKLILDFWLFSSIKEQKGMNLFHDFWPLSRISDQKGMTVLLVFGYLHEFET